MNEHEESAALERGAEWLRGAKRVCILTGAGVSAESGVPTFRGTDGLWEGHRVEDVASPEGWERNPLLVWQFYNARRANLKSVAPNPGHHALVRLEERFGDGFTLVTQNVDGLHLEAGSRRVLELHGSVRYTRCLGCGAMANRGLEPLGDAPKCPDCRGRLRPHIVWFGEGLPPDVLAAAQDAAQACEVFLVVGISAVVHPAAALIPISKSRSKAVPARVIEVNLTRTDASVYADLGLYGPSGVLLPKLVAKI
jgi:NAD-dependent deacetylase